MWLFKYPPTPRWLLRPTCSAAHSLVLLEILCMNYASGKLGGKRSKMSDQKEVMKNCHSLWGSAVLIPTLTGIITTLPLSGNRVFISRWLFGSL